MSYVQLQTTYYQLAKGTGGGDDPCHRWGASASACDSQAKHTKKKLSDLVNDGAFPGWDKRVKRLGAGVFFFVDSWKGRDYVEIDGALFG